MSELADAAVRLADFGWPVFPLAPRSKVPKIAGGRGHLDAIADPARVAGWWRLWPDANIGVRIPDGFLVIDVDPQNGGTASLNELEGIHGPLPPTLYARTGGGGMHLWYLAPDGPLTQSAHKLGPGLDIKLAGRGYVVAPPSIHPNGQRYEWMPPLDQPPAPLPDWVTAMLRPPPPPPARPRGAFDGGPSIADAFVEATTWPEILEPHGWRICGQRGEVTHWTRPDKGGGTSATTNYAGLDLLHVFTSSTPFDPNRSYTRFRAWAQLEHGGDMSAAARALIAEVRAHRRRAS